MLLERTISQLDVGQVPDHVAETLAHLGYAQWLSALKGDASYPAEATRAHALAQPFANTSPAVALFCELLETTLAMPGKALDLRLPSPKRRGGSKARRSVL